jgi:hypothetical protein
MFSFGDLFQWERFIAPSIIKIFYWLGVVVVVLWGLSGMAAGLDTMVMNPLTGLILMLASLTAIPAGILLARVACEFILIVFRINEHLGAIRSRGEM